MDDVLHIAPLIQPLSPVVPGGAEQLSLTLATQQVQNGMTARMIAARNSELPQGIELIDLGIESTDVKPVKTWNAGEEDELEIEKRLRAEEVAFAPLLDYVSRNRNDISLIHNHAFDYTPLFKLGDFGVPIVHTLHLPANYQWINQGLRANFQRSPLVSYIVVSHAMARDYHAKAGVTLPVITNGVATKLIPLVKNPSRGFLWVGRISPEKGLHTAIELVVEQLNEPLDVIGRVYDSDYFERCIRPRMEHPLVRYHGARPHSEVIAWMGQARCLLFPVECEEAFGLVLVEALASGTPVVAFAHGAVPEIVKDGENGYLIKTKEQFLAALGRIEQIDRADCRRSVVDEFDISLVAEKYMVEYRRCVSQRT